MKKILLMLWLVIATPSYALVIGGTNFNIMGYPDHTCSKPYSKPYKPYSFSNKWEVDNYNREVSVYNDELEQFHTCITDYLENAKNDIKRITEAHNNAVEDTQ